MGAQSGILDGCGRKELFSGMGVSVPECRHVYPDIIQPIEREKKKTSTICGLCPPGGRGSNDRQLLVHLSWAG